MSYTPSLLHPCFQTLHLSCPPHLLPPFLDIHLNKKKLLLSYHFLPDFRPRILTSNITSRPPDRRFCQGLPPQPSPSPTGPGRFRQIGSRRCCIILVPIAPLKDCTLDWLGHVLMHPKLASESLTYGQKTFHLGEECSGLESSALMKRF